VAASRVVEELLGGGDVDGVGDDGGDVDGDGGLGGGGLGGGLGGCNGTDAEANLPYELQRRLGSGPGSGSGLGAASERPRAGTLGWGGLRWSGSALGAPSVQGAMAPLVDEAWRETGARGSGAGGERPESESGSESPRTPGSSKESTPTLGRHVLWFYSGS